MKSSPPVLIFFFWTDKKQNTVYFLLKYFFRNHFYLCSNKCIDKNNEVIDCWAENKISTLTKLKSSNLRAVIVPRWESAVFIFIWIIKSNFSKLCASNRFRVWNCINQSNIIKSSNWTAFSVLKIQNCIFSKSLRIQIPKSQGAISWSAKEFIWRVIQV